MSERVQIALNIIFSAPTAAPGGSDCSSSTGDSTKHSDPFSLSIPPPPLVDLQAIGPLPKISLSNLSTHSSYSEAPPNESFHLSTPAPEIPKIVSPSSSFVGIEFSYPPSAPPCVPYVDRTSGSPFNEGNYRDGVRPTEPSESDQPDDQKSKKSRRSRFRLSQWSKSVRLIRQPAISPVIVDTKHGPSPPPPISLQQQQQQQSGKPSRAPDSPTSTPQTPQVSSSSTSNAQGSLSLSLSSSLSSTSPQVPVQDSKGSPAMNQASPVISSETGGVPSMGSPTYRNLSGSPRPQNPAPSSKVTQNVSVRANPVQPRLGEQSSPGSPSSSIGRLVNCSSDGDVQPSMAFPRNYSSTVLELKRTHNYPVGRDIGNSCNANLSYRSGDIDEYGGMYGRPVSTAKQQTLVLPQSLMSKKHNSLPPNNAIVKKQQN